MRPFPKAILLGAAIVLLAADSPSQAAWNNVFQVSCFHKRRCSSRYLGACCPAPAPVVAQAAPACCPQPQCTTQYIQRSYYQPVTCYQQRSYCEPVTTYQTSYYYEPVCSYRYSCYYDPCTCSYQQIATPVTSYRLRSRCNPVTTYLQRTQMVPVTSYQLSYYYEPVTTCCNTSCSTSVGAPVYPAPPSGGPAPGPGVGEQQAPLRPRVGEDPGANESFYRRYRETQPPPMNGAEGSSLRQPRLEAPLPPAPEPPKVKIDRIAYLDDHNIDGRVVRADDQAPRAGARVLLVSAEQDGEQKSLTTDDQGRFQTTLAKGGWLIYVRNREGTPVFHKRIDVRGDEKVPVMLTSR